MVSLITDGKVNRDLVVFVRQFGFDISKNIGVEDMNRFMQQHWRFLDHPPADSGFNQQPDLVQIGSLQALGCIERAVPPSFLRHCDGALVLGGKLYDKFVPRLKAAIEAYERHGCSFGYLYLLGSKRRLDPELEDISRLDRSGLSLKSDWRRPIHGYENEADMMYAVTERTNVPGQWWVDLVETPDELDGSGGVRPANTEETLLVWQKRTDFVEGDFLIVSNQPALGYQVLTATRVLPKDINIFGIGPAADVKQPLGRFLACLARQYYEEFLALMAK